MGSAKKEFQPILRDLLQAMLSWLIAALVLTMLCSAAASFSRIKAFELAYCSSAISFLSAFAFGVALSLRGHTGWKRGLIAGLFLTIVLLTLGFLIAPDGLSPDAVISVASFTVAGALLGSLFKLNKASKTAGFKKRKRRGARLFSHML